MVEHRGRKLILALHRDCSELVQTRSWADRLNQLLLEAEQLTCVGSWELIHATGELVWSEGTYRIFETTLEGKIGQGKRRYGLSPGLIQSVSQALLPGLRAWIEVGGIASSLCPKAPPPARCQLRRRLASIT